MSKNMNTEVAYDKLIEKITNQLKESSAAYFHESDPAQKAIADFCVALLKEAKYNEIPTKACVEEICNDSKLDFSHVNGLVCAGVNCDYGEMKYNEGRYTTCPKQEEWLNGHQNDVFQRFTVYPAFVEASYEKTK